MLGKGFWEYCLESQLPYLHPDCAESAWVRKLLVGKKAHSRRISGVRNTKWQRIVHRKRPEVTKGRSRIIRFIFGAWWIVRSRFPLWNIRRVAKPRTKTYIGLHIPNVRHPSLLSIGINVVSIFVIIMRGYRPVAIRMALRRQRRRTHCTSITSILGRLYYWTRRITIRILLRHTCQILEDWDVVRYSELELSWVIYLSPRELKHSERLNLTFVTECEYTPGVWERRRIGVRTSWELSTVAMSEEERWKGDAQKFSEFRKVFATQEWKEIYNGIKRAIVLE